jgi:hypothetical protein
MIDRVKLAIKPRGNECELWINGQRLTGVERVRFDIEAGPLARVRLDLCCEVEIEGEVFTDMMEIRQKRTGGQP